MKQAKWLVLCGVAILMSGTAQAAAMFGLAANVNYGLGSTLTVGTSETKPGLGFGGGLVIAFPSGNNMFDLGVHYTQRKYNVTDSTIPGLSIPISASSLHIPVVYHLGLGSKVALGIGGWYDMSMESGGGSDYGATAGLRFGGHGGFFVDAAYNMGFKDSDLGKTKEIFALIGLMFGGK